MRCLIIDDEPVAREIVRKYIDKIPQLELVAECEDAMQALNILQAEVVDVLFLDINMPGISGIGLLKSLPKPPAVIFTTAYSKYAVEGFELNVTDYLLKPFSFERFLMAVNKLPKRPDEEEPESLVLKSDGRTFRIMLTEVLYFESSGDYVTIHTKNERFTTYDRLKSLMERLPEKDFVRIHKSYIVALRSIHFVEGNQVSVNGAELPIGKTYREDFLNRFER